MLKFKFDASMILLFLCLSTRVEAMVTAEASIGRKSLTGSQTSPGTSSLGTMTGSSTNLDIYIQPYGLVPMSVGGFYTIDKAASSGESRKDLSAQTAGISVYSALKLSAIVGKFLEIFSRRG